MGTRFKIKARAFNGNAAVATEPTTCQQFDISRRIEDIVETITRRNDTDYTSHGKRKATAGEPIRTVEEIQAAKEYYLTHGKNEITRLRNHAIFVVGVSIGVRGCDLLNLKIGDVLNENGTIKMHINVYEKKTNKHNDPKLNLIARDAILMYLNALGKYKMSDYLFKSERGGKMDESQLYRILHELQTKLGLPYHISAHSLRKTFAYQNIKLHPDDMHALITLQGMMNHDSPATTLRYCGITKDDEDVFYDAIENIF